MKRDLDLIRDILLYIENNIGYTGQLDYSSKNNLSNFEGGYHSLSSFVSKEITNKEEYLLYQLDQLYESGMFGDGTRRVQPLGATKCVFTNVYLSPKGHEFLDSIRNKNIFEKIKATAQETGGNFTLELVKELGMSYLKKKIGL